MTAALFKPGQKEVVNRFKREAMYKEFPFLSEIDREPTDCQEIRVRRATGDLMHRRPEISETVGSLVDIDEGDQILLVSRAGLILGAADSAYYFTSHYAHEDPFSTRGETVLEAVSKIEDIEQIYYIVWVRYGQNIIDHRSRGDWSVTIYKPARDFEISDLVEEARGKAEAEVAAEINF